MTRTEPDATIYGREYAQGVAAGRAIRYARWYMGGFWTLAAAFTWKMGEAFVRLSIVVFGAW